VTDLSHPWTIPGGITTENAIIKICENDGPGCGLSDEFWISEVRSINVQSPVALADWEAGTTHDILWEWTGLIPYVTIDYTTNGMDYVSIKLNHHNTGDQSGVYHWKVPAAAVSPPNSCVIRVKKLEDTPEGESDPFTVSLPRSLEIVYPNGGEVLLNSFEYAVEWNSTGTIDNVDLLCSDDGGDTWESVAIGIPNASPYMWTAPYLNSTDCRMRVVSSEGRVVSDDSDDPFRIAPALASHIGVESRTFHVGAMDCKVGVYITNNEDLSGFTLPLEFRAVVTTPPGLGASTGATEPFIAESFVVETSGRLEAGGFDDLMTLDIYSQPGAQTCSGPESHTFTTEGMTLDFLTSPSAILLRLPNPTYPCLPAGSDGVPGTGDPSIILTFGVGDVPGVFEIDTCCIGPGEHATTWNCLSGQPQVARFTKGTITIVEMAAYRCDGTDESDKYLEDFESGVIGGWDYMYSTDGLQSGTNPVGEWSTTFDANALAGTYSINLLADAQVDGWPYRVEAALSDTFPFLPDLTATVRFDDIQGTGGTGVSFFQIAVLSAEDTTQRVTYGFSTTGDAGGTIKQTVSPGEEISFSRNIESDFVQETGLPLIGDVILRLLARADYAEDFPAPRRTEVRIDDIRFAGDGWGDLCDNCPFDYNPGQKDTDSNGVGDVCECTCPHQGDIEPDGFLTALDLAACIDILFAGSVDAKERWCPSPRMDLDCDGFSTALDLAVLIDHLFAGGDGPCDPCSP
jgi:hypothetical protein